MSSTPRAIGTLIVVILKAKNLPNKRHIGKQDPYCTVVYNGDKRRTRAIKRGGQHPEWDEEVRFTLFEDVEDELARTANPENDEPPPLPPKSSSKRDLKVKGGKSMAISCYADDPREPEVIGECVVDLTEVLTKGETDEWFTLMHREKYSGEVYLELTFWSNEKPPEKRNSQTQAGPIKQYGGPGSFVAADEIAANPSPRESLPTSLRASSSLAQVDLYVPPYTKKSRPSGQSVSAVEQITDEFGNLGFDEHRRRESYASHYGSPYPLGSTTSASSIHSMSSLHVVEPRPETWLPREGSWEHERATTPMAHHRPVHRASLPTPGQPYSDSQSIYQAYDSPQSNGSSMIAPSVSSGFVSIPTPAPATNANIVNVPVSSGFVPPPLPAMPSYLASYYPQTAPNHPMNGTYSIPPTGSYPIPPSSSMGFHQQSYSQSAQPQAYHYPGPGYNQSPGSHLQNTYSHPGPPSSHHPTASAPPLPYQHAALSSSQSSNGLEQYQQYQQQYPPRTPPPPPPTMHHSISQPLQYNPIQHVHSVGSRPLPQPGQPSHRTSLPSTPSGPVGYSSYSPTNPGGVYPGQHAVNMMSNPPPQPPQMPQTPPNPSFQMNGSMPSGLYGQRGSPLPYPPSHSPMPSAEYVETPLSASPSATYGNSSPGFLPPPPPPPLPHTSAALQPNQYPSPVHHSQAYLTGPVPGPPPRPPSMNNVVHWSVSPHRATSDN